MAKKNLWKTVALIGIGYAVKDYISSKPVEHKFGKKSSPFVNRLKEIAVYKTAEILGVIDYIRPEGPEVKLPKTNYEELSKKYSKSKVYKILEDVAFDTYEAAEVFCNEIRDKYDKNGGYISVSEYLSTAHFIPNIDPIWTKSHGWCSLYGMNSKFSSKDGRWHIEINWPTDI